MSTSFSGCTFSSGTVNVVSSGSTLLMDRIVEGGILYSPPESFPDRFGPASDNQPKPCTHAGVLGSESPMCRFPRTLNPASGLPSLSSAPRNPAHSTGLCVELAFSVSLKWRDASSSLRPKTRQYEATRPDIENCRFWNLPTRQSAAAKTVGFSPFWWLEVTPWFSFDIGTLN